MKPQDQRYQHITLILYVNHTLNIFKLMFSAVIHVLSIHFVHHMLHKIANLNKRQFESNLWNNVVLICMGFLSMYFAVQLLLFYTCIVLHSLPSDYNFSNI